MVKHIRRWICFWLCQKKKKKKISRVELHYKRLRLQELVSQSLVSPQVSIAIWAPVFDVLALGDTAGDEAAAEPAADEDEGTRNQPRQESDHRLRLGQDFLIAGRAQHLPRMGTKAHQVRDRLWQDNGSHDRDVGLRVAGLIRLEDFVSVVRHGRVGRWLSWCVACQRFALLLLLAAHLARLLLCSAAAHVVK